MITKQRHNANPDAMRWVPGKEELRWLEANARFEKTRKPVNWRPAEVK